MIRPTLSALLLSLGVALVAHPPAFAQAEPPPERPAQESEEEPAGEPDKRPPPAADWRAKLRGRPLTDDSNTGYIDSALVDSVFRVRYESAFDGDRPDRAEFFYGKCVCWSAVDGQDAAGGPGPAFDADYQELRLLIEFAVTPRWSVFTEVPLRALDVFVLDFVIDPNGLERDLAFDGGLGDLSLGFKRALVRRPGRALTLQVTAILPTGDPKTGRGVGHASIEPGLLYLRRLGDRLTLESEARLWVPLSGSSDPVTGRELDGVDFPYRSFGPGGGDPIDNDGFTGEIARFGAGLGWELSPGSRSRPVAVAELVGWHVLGGYATTTSGDFFEDASGDSIVNLKLGLRVSRKSGNSWYLGYGTALTDEVWYQDIFRVEYRRGF